jgi:hypothetical protein
MFNKIIYTGMIVLLLCSCKKGEKKEYAAEPSIEFLSITPSSMIEGQQTIVIDIKYTDGDGDLGENNPDIKNMFVTDSRLGITYSFRIQELAPRGQAIPITGTLNTNIGTVFITDNSAQQTANFSLYIVDRAGHASNTVTTSPVTINAQ